MASVDGNDEFGPDTVSRALGIAGWMLLACVPVMLALGRWLWGVDETDTLLLSVGAGWAAVGGPLFLATVDTASRLRNERPTRFEPLALLRADRYGAGALVGFLALGYAGVLIGLPLVLAAAATFAVAWVRPPAEGALLTRLVGATVPVLLFIGGLNIDERPVIGVILFAMALSGGLRLFLLRRAVAGGEYR